jgi:hypothetical protein
MKHFTHWPAEDFSGADINDRGKIELAFACLRKKATNNTHQTLLAKLRKLSKYVCKIEGGSERSYEHFLKSQAHYGI